MQKYEKFAALCYFCTQINHLIMKRFVTFPAAGLCLLLAACGPRAAKNAFPKIDQGGKTAIVAHRGAWNYEQAGFAQNSIASLAYAQELGLWGTEFDIHLTADDQILVFHDNAINGVRLDTVAASTWADYRLPNGETIPTLDEFLTQAEKSDKTILVCELKSHLYPEREPVLVQRTVNILKAHGLFDPSRVMFIAFSKQICDIIARDYPQFSLQFLSALKLAELSPEQLAADGINGFDYQIKMVQKYPEWVKEAHERGMSTNVWTVDQEEVMQEMIDLGLDAITTNKPVELRALLGEKEFKVASSANAQ